MDVLDAIRDNPHNLRDYKEYADDLLVVMKAVDADPLTLEYASDRLKNNKDFVIRAVHNNGYALQYASEELRNDPEVVKVAVMNYGKSIKFAGKELQDDPEMALIAVSKNEQNLRYLSPRIQEAIKQQVRQGQQQKQPSKREVSLPRFEKSELVETAPLFVEKPEQLQALLHAPESVRDKHLEYVKAVVIHNPYHAERLITPAMSNDKEFMLDVINGVARKGMGGAEMLGYASDNLRDDLEVVRDAVKVDSRALGFASERIQQDCLEAMSYGKHPYNHLARKVNEEIIQEAKRTPMIEKDIKLKQGMSM